MKLKRKHLCWGLGLLVALCASASFYWWKQQPTVLHIGVYAGSSWDVPTMPWIVRLKNLKSLIPTFVWSMKMGSRSQIIQTGSLKRLSQERHQMCLWSLSKIFPY